MNWLKKILNKLMFWRKQKAVLPITCGLEDLDEQLQREYELYIEKHFFDSMNEALKAVEAKPEPREFGYIEDEKLRNDLFRKMSYAQNQIYQRHSNNLPSAYFSHQILINN